LGRLQSGFLGFQAQRSGQRSARGLEGEGGVVQYGRRAYPILFRIGGGSGTRQRAWTPVARSAGPGRLCWICILFVPLEVSDVPTLGLGWGWFGLISCVVWRRILLIDGVTVSSKNRNFALRLFHQPRLRNKLNEVQYMIDNSRHACSSVAFGLWSFPYRAESHDSLVLPSVP